MTQPLYPLALARAHFSHEAQIFHLFSFLFPHLHVLPTLTSSSTQQQECNTSFLVYSITSQTPYISSSLCTNVACRLIIHPTCCSIPSITRTMSSHMPTISLLQLPHRRLTTHHSLARMWKSMADKHSSIIPTKASTTCLASSYKRQHHRPCHNTESPHLITIKRSTALPSVPFRPKSHLCPSCKWIGVATKLLSPCVHPWIS
jgi:hypothetical protein